MSNGDAHACKGPFPGQRGIQVGGGRMPRLARVKQRQCLKTVYLLHCSLLRLRRNVRKRLGGVDKTVGLRDVSNGDGSRGLRGLKGPCERLCELESS